MSTVNQNEFAKPLEKKQSQTDHAGAAAGSSPPPRQHRRFGTLLSANSPTPPRALLSSKKKGKLYLRSRSSASKHHRSSASQRRSPNKSAEESIIEFDHRHDYHQADDALIKEFTVTFDQGPIGLELHPSDDGSSCRVTRFLGDNTTNSSAALLCGMIDIGDVIYMVNGQVVDYKAALDILRITTQRRSITFRRHRRSLQPELVVTTSPSAESSLQALILLDDPPTRGETPLTPHHHTMQPKRLLEESPVENTALEDQSKTDGPTSFAINQQQQLAKLSDRVAELEDENQELRLSQKHAIQEMEFNMRLQSLADENKSLKEAKTRLKRKIRDMEEQQLSSMTTTLDHNDATSKNQKDQTIQDLIVKLEMSERNLQQSRAETSNKAQRLTAEEESRSQLEQRLIDLQQRFDVANESSTETNRRLLDSIRSKDMRIQELVQQLLIAEGVEDSVGSDDSSDGKALQKALDDLQAEKESLHCQINDLEAAVSSSDREKETVIRRATQLQIINDANVGTIGNLRNQWRQLQQDYAEKTESLMESEKTNNVIQQDNVDLRTVIAQLRNTVEELSAQKSQIDESFKALLAKYDNERSLRNQQATELSATIERFESSNNENERLRDDIREAKVRASETAAQLEQAERHFYEAEQRWSDNLEQLKNEKAKTLHELVEVKTVSGSTMESLCSVRQELKALIMESSTKDKSIADLRANVENMQDDIQTEQYEREQAREALMVARQLLKDRCLDLQIMNQRVAELTSSLDCISDQLSREKSSRLELLDEKNRLVQDHASELHQYRQETMVLKEEHAVTIGILQGKLEMTETSTAELQTNKDQIELKLADYINSRQRLDAEANALEHQRFITSSALQEENARLKRLAVASSAAVMVLTAKNEKVEEICSSLCTRLDEQEVLVAKHEREKSALCQKLSIEGSKLQQVTKDNQIVLAERECILKTLQEKESENEILSRQIHALSSNLDQQVETYRQQESEMLQLQRQLTGSKQYHEKERSRLQNSLVEATKSIKSVTGEHDALQIKYRNLDDQLAQANKAKSVLRNEIACYKDQLRTSTDQNRDLIAHLDKLKEEFKERRDRDAGKTRELESLKEKHIALQELHEDLVQKHNTSVNSLKTLESETLDMERRHLSVVSDMERKMAKEALDAETSRAKLAETLTSRALLVSDLRTEIKSLESIKLRLTTECSSLQTKCNALTDINKTQLSEMEARNATIATLEKDLFCIKESLVRLEDDTEKHLEQISISQDLYQSSEAKRLDVVKNLENVTALFRESRDNAARKCIDYQEKLDGLKKTNSELEKELEAIASRIETFEQKAANKDLRLRDYEEKQNELHGTLQSANEQLSRAAAQREINMNKLQAQAQQLNALKHVNDSLEESLKDLRHEYSLHCSASQKREQDLSLKSDSLKRLLEEEKRLRSVLEAELLHFKDEKSRDSFKLALSEQSEKQKHLSFLMQIKDDQITGLHKECEDNAKLIENLRHRNADLHSKVVNLEQNVVMSEAESARKVEEIIRQCKEETDRAALKLSGEINQIEQELQFALQRKTDIEQELETVAIMLSDVQRENQSAQEDVVSLQQENESLRAQLKQSRQALIEFHAENANASHSSEDSMSTSSPFKCLSKHDIKMKCLDLESDLDQADDRIDRANQEIGLRSMQIKQLTDNLSRMTEEVQSLTRANEELESHLRKSWSNNEKAGDTITLLEREKESLVGELNSAKEDLSLLKQLIQSESVSLRSDNRIQQSTIDDLRLKLSTLECSKDDLEQQVRQSAAAIAELNRELAISQQQLSNFKSQYQASKELCDQVGAGNLKLREELAVADGYKNDLIESVSRMSAEVSEKNEQLERIQRDLRDAVREMQDKDRECRVLEASAAVLGQNLEKAQSLLDSMSEEKNLAIGTLRETKQIVEMREKDIAALQQDVMESREKIALLSQQVSSLTTSTEQTSAKNTQDRTSSNEYVQSLEMKCERLRDQVEAMQESERDIHGQLIECRRQQASKEKSINSMQNRIETLKSNVKALRGQLQEARFARKNSDLRCGQLESSMVEKQMEIDQLKADSQILHSAAARLRSGSTLLSRKPVADADDTDGPQSFDDPCPTNTSHRPTDDATNRHTQAMIFLDGTMVQIERCFEAIVSTANTMMLAKENVPLRYGLYALDLAATLNRDHVWSPSFADAFQNLSDVLSRAQSIVVQQKACLRSLRIDGYRGEYDKTSIKSPGKSHGDNLPLVFQGYEEQIEILLADLQAANNALSEKDKVLEKMHDVSSRNEAERRQLQERLQLSQQSGFTEVQHTDGPNDSSMSIACQRAAVLMVLHAIDKRTMMAKSVAFRQWACHASAQQAVARQQQIAAVLSNQLQETQGKLKLLKKHLKKSRSGRGINHPQLQQQLGTIAETSRDDDDVDDMSSVSAS